MTIFTNLIDYLAHFIRSGNIMVTPGRLKVVVRLEHPSNQTEFQSFLE